MKNKFNENDEKKAIEFLNFIAQYAVFKELTVESTIAFYKLLAHMQTQILPKIKSNIFEIVEVVEAKEGGKQEE